MKSVCWTDFGLRIIHDYFHLLRPANRFVPNVSTSKEGFSAYCFTHTCLRWMWDFARINETEQAEDFRVQNFEQSIWTYHGGSKKTTLKFNNEDFCDLNLSWNLITVIKSRRVKLNGNVAQEEAIYFNKKGFQPSAEFL